MSIVYINTSDDRLVQILCLFRFALERDERQGLAPERFGQDLDGNIRLPVPGLLPETIERFKDRAHAARTQLFFEHEAPSDNVTDRDFRTHLYPAASRSPVRAEP